MTDQDYTTIALVLDRSGSMMNIKSEAEGALKQFIEDQRSLPGKATFTLCMFSTYARVDYVMKPISDVEDIKLEPMGMTALHDAICLTIDELGDALAKLPENERPGKVLFAILTDGYENHSREYNLDDVKSRIERQRDQFNWEIIFLAADQDAIAVGHGMGINAGQTFTYAGDAEGTKLAGASLSSYAGTYRTKGVGSWDADATDSKN